MSKLVKFITFGVFLQNFVVLLAQSNSCIYCERHPDACRRIAGIFMVSVLSKGTYNPIVEIPARACKINITEYAPTSNYLAVKTQRSQGIVNSYWSVGPGGQYPGAGTTFVYSHGSHQYCPGQCLFADGPLNETVIIQLLYYTKNPGISYEFVLPNSVHFTPYEGTYTDQDLRGRPETNRRHQRTHRRQRNHNRRTNTQTFEGENQGQDYSNREEEPLEGAVEKNRQELRANIGVRRGNLANRNRFTSSQYPRQNTGTDTKWTYSGTDYSGRRYGYDTLGGRGLSYSSYESGRDGVPRSGSQSPIRVAPPPRYVSPYDNTRRFTDYGTLASRSALTDRTYERHVGDGDKVDASQNRISGPVNPGYTSVESGRNDLENRGIDNQYIWRISGFTECSETCGGGFQETRIICVLKNSKTQVTVTEDNCNNAIKPQLQRVQCSSNPCPADWETGHWSACTITCGSGTQTRKLECKQRISPTLTISVSASQCDNSRKPAVAQQCEKAPCAHWEAGPWSECSVDCGTGQRRRQVQCIDHQNTQIPDQYCNDTAPTGVEQCDMGKCQRQWWTSKWSDQCSSDCGSGVQTRSVVCISTDGETIPSSMCDQSRKPTKQSTCRNDARCGGKWFTGPWSKCSSDCKNGVRRRKVACVSVDVSVLSIVADDICVSSDKPREEEDCPTELCGVEWYMSQWSECSATCGRGLKTRDVKCLDQFQRPSDGCDISSRPSEQESCQQRDCHRPQAISTRGSCRDKYSHCSVVVQARLCSYNYYKKICCASCTHH